MMMERFKKLKREFIVIYLDLPEEEAIKRLS
jgi:shikimate kinase